MLILVSLFNDRIDRQGEKVTCLQFDSNKFVTGSSDSMMKVWSMESLKQMYTLESKGGGWVRCLQYAQVRYTERYWVLTLFFRKLLLQDMEIIIFECGNFLKMKSQQTHNFVVFYLYKENSSQAKIFSGVN